MRSEFDPVLRDGEKNASVARNGVRNKLKRTFGSLIFYCCFPKDMVTHKKRRRDREIEKRKFDPAEQSQVSHIKTPFGTSNTKESAPHLLFCRIYLPTCPRNSIQRGNEHWQMCHYTGCKKRRKENVLWLLFKVFREITCRTKEKNWHNKRSQFRHNGKRREIQ